MCIWYISSNNSQLFVWHYYMSIPYKFQTISSKHANDLFSAIFKNSCLLKGTHVKCHIQNVILEDLPDDFLGSLDCSLARSDHSLGHHPWSTLALRTATHAVAFAANAFLAFRAFWTANTALLCCNKKVLWWNMKSNIQCKYLLVQHLITQKNIDTVIIMFY